MWLKALEIFWIFNEFGFWYILSEYNIRHKYILATEGNLGVIFSVNHYVQNREIYSYPRFSTVLVIPYLCRLLPQEFLGLGPALSSPLPGLMKFQNSSQFNRHLWSTYCVPHIVIGSSQHSYPNIFKFQIRYKYLNTVGNEISNY